VLANREGVAPTEYITRNDVANVAIGK